MTKRQVRAIAMALGRVAEIPGTDEATRRHCVDAVESVIDGVINDLREFRRFARVDRTMATNREIAALEIEIEKRQKAVEDREERRQAIRDQAKSLGRSS